MTPTRIFFFAAESHQSLFEWMNILRVVIRDQIIKEKQFQSRPRAQTNRNPKTQSVLEDVTRLSANQYCADCGAKNPRWVDLGLEVFICTDCSGIHQRLRGRSFVKSMTHGHFDPTILQKLKSIDNSKANKKYERQISNKVQKPSQRDSYLIKADWIKAKYSTPTTRYSLSDKPKKKTGFLLRKVQKENLEWVKYYIVLKEYFLFYSKSIQKKDRHFIDLSLCSVSESASVEGDLIFDLQTPTQIFVFKSQTKTEMKEWMEAINQAIQLGLRIKR